MNLIAFDTSTDMLSVAVQRDMGDSSAPQVWQFTGPGGAHASASLIPCVQRLMAEAGLAFADLHAIVFGAGPGSFTGLRTACSVAQGFAFGANLPVLPVDTLLAVAEEARFLTDHAESLNVLAVLDARMDEVYTGYYQFNSKLLSKGGGNRLFKPEDVATGLPSPGLPWLLAGNAVDAYAQRLPAHLAWRVNVAPTATALLRLAPALLAAGHGLPAALALPTYIRDKVAQTTQERAALKAV